jgi:selenide,water dikinase
MKGRWENLLHNLDLEVTILNSGKELLPAESIWCREALQHILKDKMIHVQHGCKVQCVNEEMIKLVSGEYIPYTHCIWATGAEAHPLAYELGDRGIDIDENGWIRVNSNLQSVSHSNIFAAGDCATIESPNYATPSKAGVYAVRSGPILIENISTCLNHGMSDSESLVEYRPQDDFLKLISCGDGTALGFRFGIPLEGKWVFELKDTIDQMFMDLFRLQNLPDLDAEEGKYDTSQYDERVVRPERLQPEEGAKLLLRKDEDVNYQRAWDVIRDMMDDEKYKQDVLKYTTRIECVI